MPRAGLLAFAAAVALPATLSMIAEPADAQSLAAGLLPAAAISAANAATHTASLRLAAADAPVAAAASDDFSDVADVHAASDAAPMHAGALGADMVCMAKVIMHEARNQPRDGQLAVAQLILTRAGSGRFPASVCGVVNQRGQFFDTNTYEPSRTGAAWATAVAVSRDAIDGVRGAVAPGALFFHAARQAPTSFFRTRQRVAMLGDHIFYR